jgi:two-component system response regulator
VSTILLVEDNDNDEILTCRALAKNKIANDVTVAHDGAEAIEILDGPQEFCLILLDLKLPKVDGFEVLAHIKKSPRRCVIPTVILTSSNEENDLVRGYADGANSFIRKPVSFKEFVEAMRQVGLYWLMVNETPPVPAYTP